MTTSDPITGATAAILLCAALAALAAPGAASAAINRCVDVEGRVTQAAEIGAFAVTAGNQYQLAVHV